jgi:argininosuccinate lyase
MKKLWGSRFKKGTDHLADQFSFSISYDYRLAKYDVLSSMAHAKMLGKCKIISAKDTAKLVSGLTKIGSAIANGTFKIDPKAEDIHTQIQTQLKKLIGDAADKLHTARSRNDLIVVDMKLFCREELSLVVEDVLELQRAILKCAKKYKDIIVPAYTHLQAAQVVLLAHHFLAYLEMFERDKSRIQDTLKRLNSMPLGSCALSGTSLPIDRNYVAKQLGFTQPTANSMDSVSDRDFLVEALADLSIMSMHTSRLAEDFIIWATSEFNFVNIDWSLCTGSSIMPHKKNPDILELIRGETAKIYSNLQEVLILLKGLPLTYNRDLQLDKPPVFESIDKIKNMLKLLAKLFDTLTVNSSVIERRIQDESFFTVDVMEYLIKRGMSYREAHDVVGTIVKECLDKGEKIKNLSLSSLQQYSSLFEADVKNLFNPEMSVKIKRSLGSTNPSLVHKELAKWTKKIS